MLIRTSKILPLVLVMALVSFIMGCSQELLVATPTVANDIEGEQREVVQSKKVSRVEEKLLEEEPLEERLEKTQDSEEEILKIMEDKYKLYKKAWRVNEREEAEQSLDYYLKVASKAATDEILQKGLEFFSGPPQGYSSSIKEILLRADIKSRTKERAVINSQWEEDIVGDGQHTKDIYNITIKMKKENEDWFITDLTYQLVSRENLQEF